MGDVGVPGGYTRGMDAPAPCPLDTLLLDDQSLLAQCDKHIYKSSGPGGQHRNKVSSAVRLRHRATGVAGHGDDSRSQHENLRLALRRLRMNLACQSRRPVDRSQPAPAVVAECTFVARGGPAAGRRRLEVGARDHRFWAVAAAVLDVLEAFEGRLAEAASHLGIGTGNLSSFLTGERHLLAAAQALRKAHGQSPLH
ncbi:MAG TPA: peptide chain release factor-like protein [Phycisphaerae bacterium]|nr:peptide chain release factor-like protein [Phycisphaerae bacterium]HQL72210.1 peptide chain release factor-like protein [Phycisphaerae bacterium]